MGGVQTQLTGKTSDSVFNFYFFFSPYFTGLQRGPMVYFKENNIFFKVPEGSPTFSMGGG